MQDKREVTRYFKELPPNRIDQHQGRYREEFPCCVEAHLAHILTKSCDLYLDGADIWAKLIGGNRVHAILILRNADAPHDPFSDEEWTLPPGVIFTAAAMAETLPDLRGTDFSNTKLFEIDLAGADLREASFRRTFMYEINLKGANLARADLSGADLRYSNMEGTDLTGAMLVDTALCDSQIAQANLTRANLQRADLTRADLKETNFYQANLTRAIMAEAILNGANLTETILSDTDLTRAILNEKDLTKTIDIKPDQNTH